MEKLSCAKIAALDKRWKTGAVVGLSAFVFLITWLLWPEGCVSKMTCADLKAKSGGGWSVGGSGTVTSSVNNMVCGESQFGFGPDGEKQCYGGMNSKAMRDAGRQDADSDFTPGWEHAHAVCKRAGARLCTVKELLAEVTRGTGCQHDAEMAWSSEVRPDCNGHIVVQGGQHRGDEACPDECHIGWISGGTNCATCACTPRCSPDTNVHAVRCCADVDLEVAKKNCDLYTGYKGPLKPYDASMVTNLQGVVDVNAPQPPQWQSRASCQELQGLYGGWPTEATNGFVSADRDTHSLTCGESSRRCHAAAHPPSLSSLALNVGIQLL